MKKKKTKTVCPNCKAEEFAFACVTCGHILTKKEFRVIGAGLVGQFVTSRKTKACRKNVKLATAALAKKRKEKKAGG